MKTRNQFLLLLSVLSFFISNSAMAQFRAGVKVAPGIGFIKSKNLKRIYERIEADQSVGQKVSISASARPSTHLSFGGFVDYKHSEELLFMAEPIFTYSFNNIIINSRFDKVDDKGTGTVTNITSEAKVRAAYFSLPLSVKYRFNQRKEFYALGGLALNFHFTPTLKSEELLVVQHYLAKDAFNTERTEIDHKLKLQGYNFFNINAFIGVGKVLNPYGRNIIVDIRYSVPISQSPLYAKGSIPADMLNSMAFTEEGKNSLNSRYPQYPLKDFRMGVFSFSMAVSLYKNYR